MFEAVFNGAAMHSVSFLHSFISGNIVFVFDDSPNFGMEVFNCNNSTSSIGTASSSYHLMQAFLLPWISTVP